MSRHPRNSPLHSLAITQMPGYDDGDWPPQEDLGMADLFTDEQVKYLLQHCGADIVDNMGGSGEALYIPSEQIDRVATLLADWGYDVARLA